MNIKERKQLLNSITSAKALNINTGGKNKYSNFKWDTLTKPPLLAYIPQNVIDQIYQITTAVRLMNRPSEKYRLMNECLAPYGFKPLNSGTNRRVFYCEYDPGIVIKIGSDNVGRNDNILEFNMANTLKPFCAKPFDLHPSGVMMLSERVEPISEKDFKDIFCGEIFDIIFSITSRGYIMEDIGANFYKNWGFRFEFGPVLIDYPYVYELDRSKLKCSFVDPKTGIKCNGWVDYDYDSGLSELVCTKCGARYSANYLGKLIPTDMLKNIIKGKRKINMFGSFNPNNLKISICQGDKVIHRYYNETEIIDKVNKSKNSDVVNNGIIETPKQRPSDYRNEYGKEVNDEIIKFLSNINYKFGRKITVSIAKRLGVYYRFETKLDSDNNISNGDIVTKLPEETPKKESMMQRVQQYKNQSKSITEPIQKVDPNKDIEDFANEYVEGKTFIDELKNTKYNTSVVDNKPVQNLNIVVPETREQREARENSSRNSNEILGIPSIPGVELMKYKQEIPKIKASVERNLNGFYTEYTEKEDIENYLKKVLETKVTPFLSKVMDTRGINYNVSFRPDVSNKDAYHIECRDRDSYVFECTVYPKQKHETFKSNVSNVPNIPTTTNSNIQNNDVFALLDQEAAKFDYSKYSDDYTCKAKLRGYLTSVLLDTKKEHPAKALKIVNSWINKRYAQKNSLEEEL